MLGILYLLLASFVGYQLLLKVFPALFQKERASFFGKPIKLPNWMIVIPGAFLVGTLFTTWFAYLVAYAFQRTRCPLFYGDLITFIALTAASVYFIYVQREKWVQIFKDLINRVKAKDISPLINFYQNHKIELWLVVIITVVWGFFVFHSFYVSSDGIAHIGNSVYSDFGSHLPMIRSFSNGVNFPTEYPIFPNGTIRYHFFFQFLAGNLNFLGQRVDWAFNLPSILSFLFLMMLIYSLAVMIMGEKWIGAIAAILFFLRSSFAFFTYIAFKQLTSLTQIVTSILSNADFIGKTQFEDRGLWALKNFVNQRHYPFSMAIFLLILIILLPLFKKMCDALKEARDNPGGFRRWMKEFFFSVDAWACEDIWRSVILGLILGLNAFWNGAIVIGALPVLFILALASKHRLEYANLAFITVVLALLQGRFFMGSNALVGGTGSTAINFRFAFGFLADAPTLKAVLHYYIEVFGILPFVLLIGAIVLPPRGWWLTFAYSIPVIFATTVQLTDDTAVNSKYVFMSFILLNIIAANFLYRLFKMDFRVADKKSVPKATMFNSAITITGAGTELAGVTPGVMYPIKGWVRFNSADEEIPEKIDGDISYTVDLKKKIIPPVAKEESSPETGKTRQVKNLKLYAKVLAGVLLALMTVTGVVDVITLYNMDRNAGGINTKQPLQVWVEKNTKPDAIFLTYVDVIDPILMGGRKIFHGWPYFAWSAGYDTATRENIVNEIYNGFNLDRVKQLLKENKISYVAIDDQNRTGRDKAYQVNETFFRNNFQLVFEDPSYYHILIFKVD